MSFVISKSCRMSIDPAFPLSADEGNAFMHEASMSEGDGDQQPHDIIPEMSPKADTGKGILVRLVCCRNN